MSKSESDKLTYIVTFEINDSTRRRIFKEKIKSISAGICPIHDSAWAIRSELKAKDIRDALKSELITSDRLFVIRSGTEAAWKNAYGTENSEWLKKYL